MSITIQSPTAEAVWQAVQQLPASEIARLKQMFQESREESAEEEEAAWRVASARSGASFFEEEEL